MKYIVTNITTNPIVFETLDDLVLAPAQTLDLLSLEFTIKDLEDNEEIAQYLIADITAVDENNIPITSNTTIINADDLSIDYQSTNYNTSTINRNDTLDAHLKGINNMFEYQYIQDNTDTVNTEETWLTKVSITNNFSGRYKVCITYKWSIDSTKRDFEGRLTIDNVLIGDIHKQEAKDSSGKTNKRGTDQRHTAHQAYVININSLSTIKFEFRPSHEGIEASCFDVLLEVYKV